MVDGLKFDIRLDIILSECTQCDESLNTTQPQNSVTPMTGSSVESKIKSDDSGTSSSKLGDEIGVSDTSSDTDRKVKKLKSTNKNVLRSEISGGVVTPIFKAHPNSETNSDDCIENKEDSVSPTHTPVADTVFDEFEFVGEDDDNAQTKKIKSTNVGNRQKWSPAELMELNRYFKENLETLTAPGMKECLRATQSSKKTNGQLCLRS